MTTPRERPSRFNDDPGFLVYRDGELISWPEGADPVRMDRIARAWQLHWATGDRSQLVALGILKESPDSQVQSVEPLIRPEDGQRCPEEFIDVITDAEYERRIARGFRSIAYRYLALHRPQVLYSINKPQAEALARTLEDAAENGVITHEANFDLDLADIIGCGENRQGDLLYVVAEVSETIYEYDISRALERADTVSRATGRPALPVVIGRDISDANRRLSDRRNVSVVILNTDVRPEPESPDA